ncbi:MAG TPA: hypothetical protein VM936_21765 [Pyrinomonadaceae bacterium]|nr:hypothetical protein [Pyrinomonadaceae bacterium]
MRREARTSPRRTATRGAARVAASLSRPLASAFAAALVLLLAPLTARAADNTVYANDVVSPYAVYTVDTTTGAISAPVGNLSFSSIALARRASDGLVFYTEYGVNNGRVATWNPTTGVNANLGTLGGGIRNFPRLAFNSTGTLYGMDDQSRLYTVNTTNGNATSVGTVTGFPASIRGDMAFNAAGTLYATTGDNSSLYTINTVALTATLVGATGQTNIAGNAFVNGGRLLAVESNATDDVSILSLANGAATVLSTQAVDLYDLASMTKFADLSISKTSSSTFIAGSNAAYTISVVNNGPHSASGPITVRDTLPAGLTYVSATGTGWTCANASGVVTCTNAGPVANGVTMNAITLTVSVGAAAAPSVINTATVSGTTTDHVSTNDSSSVTKAVTLPTDLTVAKSHAGNFTQGQSGSYSITVTNSGGVASSGTVTVSDTLPAGLTPGTATGTGWSCNTAGQTVTCTRNDALAGGASYPAITVPVAVANNASPSLTNTAAVSGGNDSNTGNNSSSDPTTVNGVADVTIAKTHSGNFTQGQNGTYTLTASNVGGAATSGTVTVSDTLPAGLSYVSAAGTGWTCGAAGQTVTCTRSDALASGSSYPAIALTVSVASNSALGVTNTAAVSGGGQTNTTNDSASDPTTVNGVADLAIAKSHSGNFTQGQNGTYTITASNAGGAATSGTVTVSDTLPAGLSYVSATGTGWTCGAAGQSVTCTRSDALAPGASYPAITLTVAVDSNSALSLTNTATVSGGGQTNTSNDSASDPTTVNGVADVTIAKTHSGNFTQGQNGTYTLAVSNVGGAATSGTVTVSDTLPAGLSYVSATGTGWTCGAAGQVVTCTRATALAAGASYPNITLTVSVATNSALSLTNTATVSGGGQTNTSNDSSSDPTTVNGVADVTVAKSHTGNFSQGQSGATYTLTVSNVGGAATSGTVTVTDTLPASLAYVSATGTGWTCGAVGQAVTCTRATALAAGASYPAITVTVNVSTTAPSSVTNTASVSGGGQTNTSNDSASDPTNINGVADLAVAKTHTGNFTRGSTGTYTITVSNVGGAATSGVVTVTDTLPAGLTPSTQSGTGWTCGAVGQTITCTRSNALAAGASYPAITVVVNVSQTAASSVTNTAAVSGGGQTNTSNDSSSDPTTVVSSSDLSLSKTVNNPSPVQGQNVTFTLTLANAGPSNATNVAVTDLLPAGLSFVSATPSAGTYTSGTGVWSVASLASGANATLQIVATVSNSGTITNTAEVTASDQPDPDSTPNNNNPAEDDRASAAVGAAAPPSIGLLKSVTPSGTQVPGTDLTYTIAFSNTGGYPASAFILTDPDPATVLKINDYMDFKLGSVVNGLGTTGLTVTVAYSNDGGASWTYTPASGAGGAPAGYDRNVTHIRWSFAGSLSHVSPNNAGSVSFTARIR